MKSKVFCIGFPKTGTSSMGVALKKLGYRVTGPNGVGDPNIAQNALSMACDLIDQYDAFQDDPWPMLYKEMDERYPNSKFILTLRDPDAWIASLVRHFGGKEAPLRKWVYGVGDPAGNEAIYLKRFNEHNEGVRNYFKDRPDDLLVMDVFKRDGWEQLCPFLQIDNYPNTPFPHANKAEVREVYEALRLHKIKKALRKLFC